MKKGKKWVQKRHTIVGQILRWPVKLYFRIVFHFRGKNYRIKRGQNAFIISNHQTGVDPILLASCFNKNIYFVATDSVFSNKFASGLMVHFFNPIPKKKGLSDPLCIKTMMKVAKEKGSIGLFAEGNRTYSEFQFYIDDGLARLIKILKMPLIIYNFNGGNGIQPRWTSKLRKGYFSGKVVKEFSVEQLAKMSNENIMEEIRNGIKIFDSDSNRLYKSSKRAESLEQMLFVCPKCNSKQTLYSHKEHIICKNCNLKVEYTENLHLKSADKDFKFDILNDWYQFQKEWVKQYNYKENETIFEDDDVKIFEIKFRTARILISKGKMTLTDKQLIFGNELVINLKDIIISSPAGGFKLLFSTTDKDYIIIGSDKFNPLKYALMLNHLDTHIKEKKTDQYYNLD